MQWIFKLMIHEKWHIYFCRWHLGSIISGVIDKFCSHSTQFIFYEWLAKMFVFISVFKHTVTHTNWKFIHINISKLQVKDACEPLYYSPSLQAWQWPEIQIRTSAPIKAHASMQLLFLTTFIDASNPAYTMSWRDN